MSENTKKNIRGVVIVYFVTSLFKQASMLVSLILSDAAVQFPKASATSIQMIYTMCTVGGLLGVALGGKLPCIINKKKLLIIFSFFQLIAGIIGITGNHSIGLLCFASCLIGIGSYALAGILSALVVENIDDRTKQASIMGKQSIFVNIGGMIMMIVGGSLEKQKFANVYKCFFFNIIIILLALSLLPDGPLEKLKKENGNKSGISKGMLPILIGTLCFGLGFMVYSTNISFLTGSLHLTAVEAGYANTLFMVGAVVSGLLVKKSIRIFKTKTMAVSLWILAAGLLVEANAVNLAAMLVGAFLIGFGFGTFCPVGFSTVPALTSGNPSAGLAMFTGSMTIGQIISPLIITNLAGSANGGITRRYMIGMIITIIGGFILTAVKLAVQPVKDN